MAVELFFDHSFTIEVAKLRKKNKATKLFKFSTQNSCESLDFSAFLSYFCSINLKASYYNELDYSYYCRNL